MTTNAERTWTRMCSSGLLDNYQRPCRLRQKTRMVFARTEIRRRQFIPAHSKLQNPKSTSNIFLSFIFAINIIYCTLIQFKLVSNSIKVSPSLITKHRPKCIVLRTLSKIIIKGHYSAYPHFDENITR